MGFKAIEGLIRFPGFYGIVVGLSLFPVIGLFTWRGTRGETLHRFDAQGEKGSFDTLLVNYLEIAKVILGLASGSIVLLVSSAAFHSTGLPPSFASPLFLLALSILYGVFFMALIMLDFESRHHPQNNTFDRLRYARNHALGFSSLLCFSVGYAWLIVIVTGQP